MYALGDGSVGAIAVEGDFSARVSVYDVLRDDDVVEMPLEKGRSC